jgi:ATP-binding cassette subfamily B protein/ATP-binding cassette subfamily C protein LapB
MELNNINIILKYIFEQKKIKLDFSFEEFNYQKIQKISKEHNLYCKKVNKSQYHLLDNSSLPGIIRFKGNKNYLLIKIDKKNKTYIVKDFFEEDENSIQEVKWTPKEIYLFLNNEEDEIFKFENDWIKSIIKEETNSYLKIFYISFFINFFILIIPFYMMSIYDRVIPLEGVETLISLTIGVGIVLFFDLLFKYIRNIIMQDISFNINNKIEDILLNKIIKIKNNHDKYSIGNKFNLFKEIKVLKDFFSTQTMVMFLEIPFFLIGLLFIWLLSENLIFVPIIITIIMFFVNYITQYKIDKKYNNLYKKETMKSDFIFETIINKNEIINKNLISKKINESYRISEEEESLNKELSLIKSNATNIFQSLIQVNNILIIFFGVFEVLNNQMTVGYLIALTILSSRVMMPIINLNINYLKYNDVKKSFKVLNNFLKLPEINDKHKLIVKKINGNFKLENIYFHYNNKYIFENLNIDIKQNDKLGIIGENSSGKTTLFNLLTNKQTVRNSIIKTYKNV